MNGILSKLKNLDAYPKVNEDFFTRTYSGGVITVVSSLVMLCLFISELSKPPASSLLHLHCTHSSSLCCVHCIDRSLVENEHD